MSRRITLKHAVVAAVAAGALTASPALGKPTDRIDRYGSPTSSLAGTTSPKQDLRGEHARDAARAAESDTQFQVGQPTWPVHPAPAAKPVKAVRSAPSPKPDGGGDDVWLVLGIGLAASGIVAGSAAGVARRTRRVPA